ncbi:PAS domain S-box protein [uncultured Eudoraea sp.]|uniref:sensor histidine kinase n=1 Tax=uncultured Eudoraea sp. TaxID=1035614 RepID=UPI002617AE8E|nr:PAS domain S-box protein [uncultured Eudoraea sp.]
MHVFDKNINIFHLLSEAISEGIIVVSQDQLIVSINKKAARLFDYSNNELLGRPLSLLIPDKYKNAHKEHVIEYYKHVRKEAMAGGRCVRGQRKSGEEFPLNVRFNPFSIYKKTYVLALVHDLSARKEIEENLIVKGEALDATQNGVVISDALKEDHPIIYVNKAFRKLTGYSESEALNRNCRFLQKDDNDQRGVKIMHKAIRAGKKCRVQVRNYKKDGTLFWNEVSITPIRNREGKITHFIGIQNDLTNRVKAEEEIRHFLNIFDESLNEIYVFDAITLMFSHVNYGAQKNTGYTIREIKRITTKELLADISEKKFRNLIDPIQLNSNKKIQIETEIRRKDGSKYPVEVHLQSSSLGNRKLIVAIVLDISERKNYTQKLEKTVALRTQELKEALVKEKELNNLKTKFLSLVSHEFKTPLSTILTSATLVGKYTTTEQQDIRFKHLKSIKTGVHHLTGILNDFLSIERLEKGKEVYRLNDFSLSKVVNEVIYNANMLLKTGQKINYPLNIEDLTIHQDEKIISLALTNLLHNAIKYSPEETEIDLEIEINEDNIRFHVIDKGIGIPKEDQKHIFNLYFRADNVLLTQGTGIGLNIVKSHVENLGGNISFKSVENKGSKFTIELPLDDNREEY